MTLISHNLHTQVIMAWLRKKFYFFKKDAEVQTKDAEVLGNTIPALMCLSGCMSDPLWGFLIQYPHIFLYTNIQSPSPYAMLSYTQMSCCPVACYNTQTCDGTSDKIWCIYLKIIKFYLISIFFFWINIHDEFDETLKLCGLRTHIQQSWISRFNFLEHSYKLREMLIWIYIQKN